MALKKSLQLLSVLFFLLLCLSFSLFFSQIIIMHRHHPSSSSSDQYNNAQYGSHYGQNLHRFRYIMQSYQGKHRKLLLESPQLFDFTPFNQHQRKHVPVWPGPGPGWSEIDPVYGVEKRRVPTGPNPLHH